jgi:anti-anti-sigma regulatory factor
MEFKIMVDKKVYKDESILYVVSSSLTVHDVNELKELCLNILDESTGIVIDLENIVDLDIAGFQFIKSLENYALVHGISIDILNTPDSIKAKFKTIGVIL